MTACALGLVLPVLAVAQINIGINVGTPPPPPPIVVTAPPQLVVIPGMPVSLYAPAMPYSYFFYGGRYYIFHEGYGFMGRPIMGPGRLLRSRRCLNPSSVCLLPTTRSHQGTAERKADIHGRMTTENTNIKSTTTMMISKDRGTRSPEHSPSDHAGGAPGKVDLFNRHDTSSAWPPLTRVLGPRHTPRVATTSTLHSTLSQHTPHRPPRSQT